MYSCTRMSAVQVLKNESSDSVIVTLTGLNLWSLGWERHQALTLTLDSVGLEDWQTCSVKVLTGISVVTLCCPAV